MEYGYPLLRHTTLGGAYEWFYPEVPTEWNPNIVPRLVPGIPASHHLDGYRVCTFTVADKPSSYPPIVLSVKKL